MATIRRELMKSASAESSPWPTTFDGKRLPTKVNHVLGLAMCEDCWNGKHKREGCKIPGCQCGCYQGRNKGLAKPHKPHREVDTMLPDHGGIQIG